MTHETRFGIGRGIERDAFAVRGIDVEAGRIDAAEGDLRFSVIVIGDERIAVKADETAAPLVRDRESGAMERDFGNADAPSDEAIAVATALLLKRRVKAIRFADTSGDSSLESIYDVTFADSP